MHLHWPLSVGLIRLEDIKDVIPHITGVKTGKKVMIENAQKALKNDEVYKASILYRFAEFFSSPYDEDKGENFQKSLDLFYSIDGNKEIERVDIPYEDYFLRTFHMKPEDEIKGQIVLFGGSDSVAEDFLAISYYFVKHGYEIFFFEGPGQGNSIYKYNKPFIQEWEKPVKAILDYFNLKDVTLIGTSFGGWLVLRAAAFEPRVQRVIAFDIIYDLYECFFSKRSLVTRVLFKFMLKVKAESLLNRLARKQMEKDMFAEWVLNFGMYINGVKTPYQYFKTFEKYNVENHHPSRITQDVLLLAGEEDHFIPVHLLEKQKKMLKNAKSVTGRVFTKKEHAEQHCQVGNMQLALDVMIDWINQKS
jgi:pimeloyl-ACP methyl ester carboxylesterase